MTRPFLLTLFLIGTLSGMTQIIGERVNKYAIQNAIDTYLVYSFPCSGGISFDSCQYDEPHYLIWQQNGDFFLKRFDYCKTYKILSLDTANPLTYYMTNKTIIDQEEIKQPTYFDVRKTRKKIDSVTVTSTVSHSCFHKFQSPLMNNPKYKYADTYDLGFKTFEDGTKNIYYEDNIKTKFKSLIDLTTALIKQLETGNKFASE
jgi:hypothetical protein